MNNYYIGDYLNFIYNNSHYISHFIVMYKKNEIFTGSFNNHDKFKCITTHNKFVTIYTYSLYDFKKII